MSYLAYKKTKYVSNSHGHAEVRQLAYTPETFASKLHLEQWLSEDLSRLREYIIIKGEIVTPKVSVDL